MRQIDYQSEIIRKTTGMIRTFLDELANGTSTYKSLHNLTEQVEHQYHGRFLIELIQNAHDALGESSISDNLCRLEIIIDQDELPHGALYVANDGDPFTRSNFECLSQLGQSDKDPEKCIGNKGIGFRSVLEITDAPEIYSRSRPGSKTFDGYCFYFSPPVRKQFEAPIRALLNGNDRPYSPLDNATPLVEWSKGKIGAFRGLYSQKGTTWIINELNYLSPYLLPIPIKPQQIKKQIRIFQEAGFATVIRIPFKNDKAKIFATEILDNLDENTILFLDRAKCLALNSGTKQRIVKRKPTKLNDPHNGQEITLEVIEDGTEKYIKKRYWLWTEEIGGKDNPAEREEIKAAVADLPGKWPELTKAQIFLAVKIGDAPEEGRINIYLPTELPTGCSTHFSGPFFGDMSRTDVDFKKPFNDILLKRIGQKSIEIILESLAGKGLEEARAIIDILAPSTEEERAGEAWFSVLKSICEQKRLKLSEQHILLSDKGWDAPNMISLIPELENPVVMTEEKIRAHAEFQAIVEGLISRKEQIKKLFEGIGIDPFPLTGDLAGTVESIAQSLCDGGGSEQWNGFWEDSIRLFGRDPEPLKGKKVLLGNDNTLHASGSDCTVFFTPRQGVDDDDIQGDGAVRDIPDSVKPFVSFLNNSIKIYDEKDARIQTPVRRFLDSTLVQRFRVEDILRTVLVPKMPTSPVKLKSKEGDLCRDILLWALRLVAGMPDRGQGRKSTLRWLRQLRVPCLGGWYLLEEASFGPGWANTAGKYVFDYLQGAGSKECKEALNRILQPPQHMSWDKKGESYRDLLISAAVFDGLRITYVQPNEWKSQHLGSKDSYQLPKDPLPCIPEPLWKEYVEVFSPKVRDRLYYAGLFQYDVQSLSIIPGLDLYTDFNDETRIALMNALFAGFHQWEEGWKISEIKKVEGVARTVEIESPLSFALRTISWIGIEKDGTREWERPSRRWYVPKDSLAGRAWQFGHLRPLPGTLADKIDRNQGLAKVLGYLGMPKFDPEERTSSTRLLEDLATALNTDLPDRNTFLNHIRVAWNTFNPGEDGSFPDKIIVSNGPRTLQAVRPGSGTPVYLPDSSASFISALGLFSLPVIEIETPDAKRLATHFKRTYGDAVRLASELTVWPIAEDRRWEIQTGDLLVESDYSWIVPVSLTLFAFSGSKPQGPYTKRFASTAKMLRDVRICWVPSLKAGLWKSEEIIATPSIPAMWLEQEKTLVCDENFKHRTSKLSEAIEAMMGRDDLELPLKHVFEKLESIAGPTNEDLCSALESLKISQSQFNSAYEQWRGDLNQIIKMIMAVVTLYDRRADIGAMSDISTEEALLDFLTAQKLSSLFPMQILELVRASDDYFTLGKHLYNLVGESAQLDKWNTALEIMGEKRVSNNDAKEDFQGHLQKIRVPLQATLAHILRRDRELGVYKLLVQDIDRIECPEELATEVWEIGFNHAVQCVKGLLGKWRALPEEISAIVNGHSPEDIQTRLKSIGINANISPSTVQKQNRDLFMKVIDQFQKIAMAWCLRQNLSPLSWEKTLEEVLSNYDDFFNHGGYLKVLGERDFFSLLKQLPRENAHVELWNRVDACDDLPSLMTSLSVSQGDLAGAEKNLESYKESKRREKRLVSVCGKDFDSTDDNLGSLWNLISSEIKETAIPEVNLNKMTHLLPAERTGKKKPRGDRQANSPKPKGRTSKAMENLVGFAGEIHAYRMLLRAYGETVVHPSTWRSLYSQLVFPDNIPDDGAGCDFILHHKGKRIHIEVKSSLEDDETFQLGSSEIELAIELVRKKKDEFLIMHVNKVLTNDPGFRLLPNPYDPKNQGLYSFEEAGMRVKYHRKS